MAEVKQIELPDVPDSDRAAPPAVRQPAELSVGAVVDQAAKIQQAMSDAMKQDVHFGVIPGCQKPSLLQPGAEKLCLMFRLAPAYTIEREFDPNAKRDWTKKRRDGSTYGGTCDAFIRYTVNCNLVHGPTHTPIAGGVGVANNWEPKFISRDPYEVEETILQFARKRALVNAARTGTAASDIFTQDEDLIPKNGDDDAPARPAKPTSNDSPRCPACNGPMWDNTEQRAADQKAIEAGTRKSKPRPAYKCKNSDCGNVIWPAHGENDAPAQDESNAEPPVGTDSGTITDSQKAKLAALVNDIKNCDDPAPSAEDWRKKLVPFGINTLKGDDPLGVLSEDQANQLFDVLTDWFKELTVPF